MNPTTITSLALAMILLAPPITPANVIDNSPARPIPQPLPPAYPVNATGITAAPTPYVVGYMTGSNFAVTSVKVSVSFTGTDSSVIQSNNRLMAGIFETVFTSTAGLDVGYRGVAVLTNSGSIYLIAQVDEYCEGLLGSGCGGVSETNKYTNFAWPTMSVSDTIIMYMSFDDSTHAHWYYSVNGGPWTQFGEYTVPSYSQHSFQVGTVTRCLPTCRTAKYFQFSIWSDYNIGLSGWHVYLTNQQYYSGTWTLVSQAGAVQGSNAWLDYMCRWEGRTTHTSMQPTLRTTFTSTIQGARL